MFTGELWSVIRVRTYIGGDKDQANNRPHIFKALIAANENKWKGPEDSCVYIAIMYVYRKFVSFPNCL